ncbi:MAG: VCBS repeat-containing protein [Candidatus Binatia bacterium]
MTGHPIRAAAAILDLNEDRVGDLVIANGTTTLTIVYGVDEPAPRPRTVTQVTSCGATALDAADFSADGRIDIAVGCGAAASAGCSSRPAPATRRPSTQERLRHRHPSSASPPAISTLPASPIS